jgi:hypothetical protein
MMKEILTLYREMLEKMMAMAQVIKNLSVENEQLKETRKRNRCLNFS